MPDGTRSTGSPWSSRYSLRRQCRILPPRFDNVALTVGVSRMISRSAVSPIDRRVPLAPPAVPARWRAASRATPAWPVAARLGWLPVPVELGGGGGGTNSAWYAYSTRNDRKTAIRMRRSMATVSRGARDQRRGRRGDDTGANGGFQARARDPPRGRATASLV